MARQPKILAGQTVAITGGARGIGRATARALARQGMRVAIGDLDARQAGDVAEALGPSAIGLPLDVTERDSFSGFLDRVEEQLGPVDVVVNNAGIMQTGPFLDEDDLTARRMVDINIHGVILGTKLALARMIPRDSGHVVNIASVAGRYGSPGGATYSATKHAVVGLTEAVRGELHLMGSQVELSYVLPVVVNTELGAGLGEARGARVLEPDDVAEAIVDALRDPVVDVWVPKSVKRTSLAMTLLPRPVAEGIARAMKANRVLTDTDSGVRRDYELRAARSEPSLAPAEQVPQLAETAGERP